MLNDMYHSQGDEYKSRYRENYFELLRHLISPRAYISGAEITAKLNQYAKKKKQKDYEQNDEMVFGSGGDGSGVRLHED